MNQIEHAKGFQDLNTAAWHRLYRLTILRRHLSPFERAEHLRYWRLYTARAKAAPPAPLPG